MRCAHCTISLADQPVVTDEEGRSYCKICWLDEIEPQRRASEQKDIIGCALCGDLFPADQVKQIENVFVCTPCATRAENRTPDASTTLPSDAGKLPVPTPEVVAAASDPQTESNSMLDRSPVLKLARGLLRSVSAGTR
jgi:hypothetical protein